MSDNRPDDWPGSPLGLPAMHDGLRVIQSPSMARYWTARRTWKERLLTRPWRPWIAAKRTEVIIRHGDTLYMHPATWDSLRRRLPESKRTL